MPKTTNNIKTDIPKHVGIIPDGNRRWAKTQGKPTLEGHKVGVERLREIVLAADKAGVEYLSIFTFSTENWSRAPDEVAYLMELLYKLFTQEAKKLDKENIKVGVIGSRDNLEAKLLRAIEGAEKLTATNTGLRVTLCFNYGGRAAILEAARKLSRQGEDSAQLDEAGFHQLLDSAELPDIDLLIRTSGEQRISNFMLWEAAYAELYFPDVMWPDFNEQELGQAFAEYTRRQRRFGR